jgi:large repetitive protein
MKRTHKILASVLSGVLLAALCACGGGGGGGGGTVTPITPPVSLVITTTTMPDAVQGRAYSATIAVTGAVGALKWAISQAPGVQFPTGLAIDANTGVLSGTANFALFASFMAQVSDSQGHSAAKVLQIIADPPLSAATSTDTQVNEYTDLFNGVRLNLFGGVFPYTARVVGGALPAGLRVHPSGLAIVGSAFQLGAFSATVEIRDSFSPPEVVTQVVNVTVVPASLTIANSLPTRLLVNVPFSGRVVARGGTGPYTFSLPINNSLPPGMSLDSATGSFSGTPVQAGSWGFIVDVADSSTPARSVRGFFSGTTDAARGRNDTPAAATPLIGGAIGGSISPYIDPPNGAPNPADGDYYKIVSAAGLIVKVSTFVQTENLLDTVLEIVDGNGIRYNTCRQPGDTATVFNTACLNDDIGGTPHNTASSLDFQVPGTAGSTTTFYAHVIDWRGDARPDLTYFLHAIGANLPLSITTTALKPVDVGTSYFDFVNTVGGSGTNTWTLTAGTPPPGITLQQPFGQLSGFATTAGSFPFTLQVTDTSNPPQVATAQFTINVFPALAITTPAAWPDACVNQPYSFTVQATGGAPVRTFILFTFPPMPVSINQTTGVVSGTPTTTGLFPGLLQVQDSGGGVVQQNVSLNVKTCP